MAENLTRADVAGQLKGSLLDKAKGVGNVLYENVVGGRIDDYESPGEKVGTGIGAFLKSVPDKIQSFVERPVETTGQAVENLDSYLEDLYSKVSSEDPMAAMEAAQFAMTGGVGVALAKGYNIGELLDYDPNVAKIFIGPVGADNLAEAGQPTAKKVLSIAKVMKMQNASPEEIRNATNKVIEREDPSLGGVSTNAAGAFVVELDDSKMDLRSEKAIGKATGGMQTPSGGMYFPAGVEQVLKGDKFSKAYPNEGSLQILTEAEAPEKGVRGTADPETGRVQTFVERPRVVNVTAHELQHLAQYIENFPKGGNLPEAAEGLYGPIARDFAEISILLEQYDGAIPDWEFEKPKFGDTGFANPKEAKKTAQQLLDEADGDPDLASEAAMMQGDDILNSPDFYLSQLYRAVAGEVEARNVQTRLSMTAAERRATRPEDTEDIPRDQQVVVRGDGMVFDEKADGGEMRKGVGSLSETARRMNEGGEANINYSLGDIEYRADLEPHMDPLAEMGFDVNKIDYDMMYDRSNNRSQGSHFNPNNDRILISPEDYSSKGVAAHEMRHRGLERLFRIVEQGYPTAKKLGLSKEDYFKILRLYKLDQQQDRQRRVNNPDFEYSDYAHEKIAEGFEKDETINRGAQYFLSNPNAPVFTFDRKERRPRTPAERLLLMQDALRENAMSGEQAFGPDLSIKKFTPSPTSMEAFRETEGRAEIERYLNEGPQNTPEGISEFAEQALAAQRYADIINERNKTIRRNTSEYAMGGEAKIDTRSGQEVRQSIRDALENLNDTEIQDQWGKSRKELKTALDMLILQEYHGEYEPPVTQGVGSLSETARRMNEGGEAKIYIPTQEDLDKMALRVKKTYGFDPVKEALKEGVDPDLALRIMMRESSGDHSKGSDKGAIGLMGLMPITAEDVGVDRTDPYENYVGGLRYLKKMQARFGDVEGIAAYNAGPTAVEKYEGIPPFAETQAYVRAVLTPFTGVDYEDQIQEDAETALMQMPVQAAENVMTRPRARPPVLYDGPRPMQRPTLPQEIIGQPLADLAPPQNLQQKYSLEGIEQMLTGTNSELLLPKQFQQGSPYSSMR